LRRFLVLSLAAALAAGQTAPFPRSLQRYLELTPEQVGAIQVNEAEFAQWQTEASKRTRALTTQRETALSLTPPDVALAGGLYLHEIEIRRESAAGDRQRRVRNWALLTMLQRSRLENVATAALHQGLVSEGQSTRIAGDGLNYFSYFGFNLCAVVGAPPSSLRAYLTLSAGQWASLCAALRELELARTPLEARLESLRSESIQTRGAEPLGRIAAAAEETLRELRALDRRAIQRNRALLTSSSRRRPPLIDSWLQASHVVAPAECTGMIEPWPPNLFALGGAVIARVLVRAGAPTDPTCADADQRAEIEPVIEPGVPPRLAEVLGLSRAQQLAIEQNDRLYNLAQLATQKEIGARLAAVEILNRQVPLSPLKLGEEHEELRRINETAIARTRGWSEANRAVLTPFQKELAAGILESRELEPHVRTAFEMNLLPTLPAPWFPFQDAGPLAPGGGPLAPGHSAPRYRSTCFITGLQPVVRSLFGLSAAQASSLCTIDSSLAVELNRLGSASPELNRDLEAEEKLAAPRPLVLGRLLADIDANSRAMAAARSRAQRAARAVLTPAQVPRLVALEDAVRKIEVAPAAYCEGLITFIEDPYYVGFRLAACGAL